MKAVMVFFETKQGQIIKNAVVCLGASVVLLGALFKLMHWPGAGPMLVIGMSAEAFLFAFFAILPPHKEYHWEKLYPGLDVSPHEDHMYEPEEGGGNIGHGGGQLVAGGSGDDLTHQLDQALEEANIGPELIENLGSNLNRLGESLEHLGDLTDASLATNEFSEKAMMASKSLEEMGNAYAKATYAAESLGAFAQEAGNYKDEMQSLSQNLNSLNEMYELELQNSSNTFRSIDKFYESVNAMLENMEASAEDTKKYRQEIAGLAQNLSTLNQVYGGMLSAMSAVSRDHQ